MKTNNVILILFISLSNIYSQEKLFSCDNIHLYINCGKYELYYEAGGYNNKMKHFSPVVYEEYSNGKYKIIGNNLICTDSATKRKYFFRYLNKYHLKTISKDSTLKGLIFELSNRNEMNLPLQK